MSVSNLGPFPLTGIGQQLTIIPAGQYSGPNQLSQVLLTNLSYYTIALTSSTDGTLTNLLPGQVNVYPAPRSGGSLTGAVIAGADTSEAVLDAQLALADTTFDGSYPFPVTLTRAGTVIQSVLNVQPGEDYTYVLPSPLRLVAFFGSFGASGDPGTRYPSLQFLAQDGVSLFSMVALTPSGVTANQSAYIAAWPGSPAAPVQTQGYTGNGLIDVAPFPSILLPAGASIATSTGAIQAGDQWGLNLTFATS